MLKTNCEIWLTLDSRTTGGIETHVLQLAKGLTQQQLKIRVIFIKNHGDHPLRKTLIAANIKTTSLDGSFYSLLKAIKKYQPLLIHSHGYKAGIMCRLATRLHPTPLINTYHAGEAGKGKMKLYDWLDRKTAQLNHCTFAVSHKISRSISTPSKVLDNFIEIPAESKMHGHQIAFVGRLNEEKGPDLLLKIAHKLKPLKFHVYGGGPLQQTLKNNAADNVIFHGNQQHMEPHWNNIGLLLMPSRHEGLPLVALEAMARRIPVIAFNVGALDKVIINGFNGWLIEPGNLKSFQQNLENWLTLDRFIKGRIRDAARTHIQQNFSTQKIIPVILRHYANVVGKVGRSCDALCKDLCDTAWEDQNLKIFRRYINNL